MYSVLSRQLNSNLTIHFHPTVCVIVLDCEASLHSALRVWICSSVFRKGPGRFVGRCCSFNKPTLFHRYANNLIMGVGFRIGVEMSINYIQRVTETRNCCWYVK